MENREVEHVQTEYNDSNKQVVPSMGFPLFGPVWPSDSSRPESLLEYR